MKTKQVLLQKHTSPNSVNIEGVDQMVLISVEVPEGVNNIWWGGRGLPEGGQWLLCSRLIPIH